MSEGLSAPPYATSELAHIVPDGPAAAATIRSRPAAARLATAMFAVTLFLSAALLFVVEPMFAKMVLPRLGGSPAVWNTCVVFFQAAMLAGYGYAHLTSRWLPLRKQVVLHVALVVVAGMALPVAIPDAWLPPVDRTPVAALFMLLLVALGAPFFVVSSTAPLLQRWFSQTEHPSASDPYFLYAASNLGSIVALVAYPFVVEPSWPLSTQSVGWAIAYLGFAILTVACAAGAMRHTAVGGTRVLGVVAADGLAEAGVTWSQRGRWLVLALVPSSLLLGVTTFLSTDLAAMPLLWTIPLALYLLTFVLAFASRPVVSARVAGGAVTILVTGVIVAIFIGLREPAWLLMPLHLAGFFACALALHTQLAHGRPATRHLTEFYLWISVGGLLGGIFNTLIAPVLFSSVAEYPLVLVAALALRPPSVRLKAAPRHSTLAGIGLPLALGGVVTGILFGIQSGLLGNVAASAGVGLAGVLYAACAKHPVRLAAGLIVAVMGTTVLRPGGGDLLHAERTFFGVHRVTSDRAAARHRMFHGSTLHGEQSTDVSSRGEPLTYYHRSGPIGQTFGVLSNRLQRVAVIGLGAGTLAAYAGPGQRWTFYEIDPAVERIARTRTLFTYLHDCGDRCEVVLGDARLSLARAQTAFDLIILDAFSSDAIPVHLLTREALAVYLAKLSPDGVIAFHISSRYLDLRPVIGAVAAELGLLARVQGHRPDGRADGTSSLWVIAARTAGALGALGTDARWDPLSTRSARAWSDDYSDVLSVLGRPKT